jgi:hypothetical protein
MYALISREEIEGENSKALVHAWMAQRQHMFPAASTKKCDEYYHAFIRLVVTSIVICEIRLHYIVHVFITFITALFPRKGARTCNYVAIAKPEPIRRCIVLHVTRYYVE